jgi:hypothetical protein
MATKLVFSRLERLAADAGGQVSERLQADIVKMMKKRLRSEPVITQRRLPPPPQTWLVPLGTARWRGGDLGAQLKIVAMTFSAKTAARFRRSVSALHRLEPGLTENVSLDFLRRLTAKYETEAARTVTAKEMQNVRWKSAGWASEAALVQHKGFLASILRDVDDVERLAADGKFLSDHGLKELSSEPLLFTSVRTAGWRGSSTARLPYVDLAVLFRATAEDGGMKFLVKVRGQAKLKMVDSLITDIDLKGDFQIGQLFKDELRKGRGAWHLSGIPITQEQLIQDGRITKVVTVAAREMTDDEDKRLREIDGIIVEHFVHEYGYERFYRWADEVVKQLGLVVRR